jgi:hypothetical protein
VNFVVLRGGLLFRTSCIYWVICMFLRIKIFLRKLLHDPVAGDNLVMFFETETVNNKLLTVGAARVEWRLQSKLRSERPR